MKKGYSYKFWSRILTPLNWVTMKFGYYIMFKYSYNRKTLFDRFDGFGIQSKKQLNK